MIRSGAPLGYEEIEELVGWLASETVDTAEKAELLHQWHQRGETPEEIATLASILRKHAVPLHWGTSPVSVLDVVGTGGDHVGLINLSTAAALIAAAAGIPVAKHGNRAATSLCGSADVIEALGIPINLTPQQAAESIRRFNFAFLFAPLYHPLFKQIAPARRLCAERGQLTIFNYLGPLLNPAKPSWQVLGVPEPKWVRPMALALHQLGVQRAVVVCGEIPDPSSGGIRYIDELSVLGRNWIVEYHLDSELIFRKLEQSELPAIPGKLADLKGGDAKTNARLLRDVLEGRDRSIRRAAVLLNAGAALYVAGKAESILHGWEIASGMIDCGIVAEKLAELAASAAAL